MEPFAQINYFYLDLSNQLKKVTITFERTFIVGVQDLLKKRRTVIWNITKQKEK